MNDGGDLLLLSTFSRPRKRWVRAGCAGSEAGCELQAACMAWRGWGDQTLGSIGGTAEATFETLRTLMAFDGDWLELSAGGVARLVRIRAVPGTPPCVCCCAGDGAAGCRGDARQEGVIYLRRAALEYLLGGGDGGELASPEVHINSRTHTHTHISTCVHIYVYIYIFTYVYVNKCVYTSKKIYICNTV